MRLKRWSSLSYIADKDNSMPKDGTGLLLEIEKLKTELELKNKELKRLSNQYIKLQNSMKYQVGSWLINSIRRPWTAPKETLGLIKAINYRVASKIGKEAGKKGERVVTGLRASDLELDIPDIFIKAHNIDLSIIDGYINQLRNDTERARFLLMMANFGYEHNFHTEAIQYAEKALRLDANNKNVIRRLIGLHHRMGNITERYQYLLELKRLKGRFIGNEFDMAEDEYQMLTEKWKWKRAVEPLPKGEHVVHILNKYYPEINGYTVRSYEIIKQQKRMGWEPTVITKFGWVDSSYKEDEEFTLKDNVMHYYLTGDRKEQLNKIPMTQYFDQYADSLYELLKKIKPKIIHAASNFQNALPALEVAKKAGIPSIYEVRGLWHHTQSSKTEGFENSDRFKLHEEYELYCCEIADRVVVICQSLHDYLVESGIDPNKMTIVPNAVDIEEFTPIPRNPILMRKYKLDGYTVIGFIGSLTVYEGLDYLIDAFAMLVNKGLKVKLLIVGSGPILNDLKTQAASLGVEKDVIFTGRVPREKIKEYYSVADIFPFPRINAKVSQLVTPLKPYEAMAMKKTVIVSDIPALREMVIDGVTGLVCEAENKTSLADAIEKAIGNESLAENAYSWVREERDWNKVANLYDELYKSMS